MQGEKCSLFSCLIVCFVIVLIQWFPTFLLLQTGNICQTCSRTGNKKSERNRTNSYNKVHSQEFALEVHWGSGGRDHNA